MTILGTKIRVEAGNPTILGDENKSSIRRIIPWQSTILHEETKNLTVLGTKIRVEAGNPTIMGDENKSFIR